MANRIPQILAVPIVRRCSRLALACLPLLFLGACDRPGMPPSPGDPAKPQMQALAIEPSPDVRPAIFNYARPAKTPSSSLEPGPEDSGRDRLQV